VDDPIAEEYIDLGGLPQRFKPAEFIPTSIVHDVRWPEPTGQGWGDPQALPTGGYAEERREPFLGRLRDPDSQGRPVWLRGQIEIGWERVWDLRLANDRTGTVPIWSRYGGLIDYRRVSLPDAVQFCRERGLPRPPELAADIAVAQGPALPREGGKTENLPSTGMTPSEPKAEEPRSVAGGFNPREGTAGKILRNLAELEAFDEASRATLAEFCGLRDNVIGCPDSHHIQDAKRKLKELGLIQSKLGSRGGFWLTPNGRRIAEEITPR
jgi:hypothetical protein